VFSRNALYKSTFYLLTLLTHRGSILAVDEWAVTFGTARRGLGGRRPRPGPSSLYHRVPPWSWKVMEFRKTIFQAWKVMENSKSHGK